MKGQKVSMETFFQIEIYLTECIALCNRIYVLLNIIENIALWKVYFKNFNQK